MINLKKIFCNGYYRFDLRSEIGFYNHLDDEKYLTKKYGYLFEDKLDFNNLRTFNQKLQWLKVNDHNINYISMVDKFEVKRIVSEKIGEKFVIPTLGVWDSFEDINFDNLPNSFVLKCTHDSGGNVIVRNKVEFDKNKTKKIIEHCLNRNYFFTTREWPYKNVKPRIIAEKYMTDKETNELRDYKFFCFNGKVRFFKVDFNRFKNHRANYYDCNGHILPFGEKICPPDFENQIKLPQNLKLMIDLAEIMSKNIIFVRVDFYEVNGNVYFGEFTFYPASGFGHFVPESWDYKIGKMLQLPID